MKKEVLLALIASLIEDEFKRQEITSGHRGPRGFDGKDFIFSEHEESITTILKSVFEENKETLKLKFEDLTEEEISYLKGSNGRDGKDFSLDECKVEILDQISKLFSEKKEELRLKLSDLTEEEKLELKGLDGRNGKDGRDFSFEEHRNEILDQIAQVITENKDQFKLRFEDLTEEEIDTLKGKDGSIGPEGKSFSWEEEKEKICEQISNFIQENTEILKLKFSDLTPEEISAITGPRGFSGKNGLDGKDFNFEEQFENISGVITDYLAKIQDTLKLKFSDLSQEEKEELRGFRGARGARGQTGKKGKDFVFEENKEEINSQVTEYINSIKEDLKLKFKDLTKEEIHGLKLKFQDLTELDKEILKGKNGVDGKNGVEGPRGKDAPHITDIKLVGDKKSFSLVFIFSNYEEIETNKIPFPKGTHSQQIIPFVYAGSDSGSNSIPVSQDSITVVETPTKLNFTGDLVTVTDGGDGVVNIAIKNPDPANVVLPNIPCDETVYVGAAVRMTETLAVNALADSLENSNVIGIVESKPDSTRCNIRVLGVALGIYSGLDISLEYYLSDTIAGGISSIAPTTSGHVKLKLGQPFNSTSFLFMKGTRVIRA